MITLKISLLFLLVSASLQGQESPLLNSIARGQELYAKKCKVCHGKDGLGKGKRIPPLANSDYLVNNQEESILGILFGQKGEIIVNGILYDKKMRAIKLTDQEVADVMNYIQNSWGNNDEKLVTENRIAQIRKNARH